MVQVPRRAEYADVTPQAFDEGVKSMAATLGAVTTKTTGDIMDEMNARLKALGGKPLAVDNPEMIGELFRKTDAVGWAMLMGITGKDSDATATMAMAISLIRAKDRILFAYVYRAYESPESIDVLRKIADSWTNQILKENK
jgi:hypothetical protein